MKIKQSPKDFIVTELLPQGFVLDKGEFEVYSLKKTGVDTLRVINELRRKFGSIGYAGLKDKHGITTQYVTMKKGEPVKTEDYELKNEGYALRHLMRGDNEGNRFKIRVELTPEEIKRMSDNESIIREKGFKNYYDKQRTGHELVSTSMIHYLLKGDYKTALLRYYIHKSKYAGKSVKKAYKECFNNWGSWSKCNKILNGKIQKITLKPLGDLVKTGDLVKAINAIPKEELELLMAGYQALLFNESLKEVNEARMIELPVIRLPKEFNIKARKGRRMSKLKPLDLLIKYSKGEAVLTFTLPKGAYATVLLNELVKE